VVPRFRDTRSRRYYVSCSSDLIRDNSKNNRIIIHN